MMPDCVANNNKMHSYFLCLTGALLAFFAFSMPARAEFKVWSPHVEEGMMEFEYKGRLDFDDRQANDDFQQHKLEIKYGVANWAALAVEGEVKKENGKRTEYEATELEAYLQFTEPGEYWVDSGAKLAYEITHDARSADKAEALLLLQKQIERFDNILNLKLEQQVGKYRTEDTEFGASFSTRYLLDPRFAPGFEWHSDFGEIEATGNWDHQKHHVGPVVYGNLGHGFVYEIGYLFGISDNAADGSAKLIVECEFPL